jgi:hypothetical protein
MDAMQNDSANAAVAMDEGVPGEAPEESRAADTGTESAAEGAEGAEAPESPETPERPETREVLETPEVPETPETLETPEASEMPQPRSAEGESPSAKGKKRKSAPKPKAAAATKSLVVFRDGKVHYADESVVVLDLDEAAHADTDVHDVVDKLSELRDAVESPGRAEAVTLVAELIQAKALA